MVRFIVNSILLGVGLAMDAFSVSIVNGLNETHMSRAKTFAIPGTYAAFQFAMPMIGWLCVHRIAEAFTSFQKYIPWIALLLLLYIGGKMLIEGIRNQHAAKQTPQTPGASSEEQNRDRSRDNIISTESTEYRIKKDSVSSGGISGDAANAPAVKLGAGTLFLQGVATSIDALSVGFTIAEYPVGAAILCSTLVAMTTFCICMTGLLFGKRFGERLADKATVLGGLILIFIGVEIFVGGI